MAQLLRLLGSWSVRRLLLFVLVAAAMVAFVKVKEAWDALPALQGEIAALEEQRALLETDARAQAEAAERALGEIGAMEQAALAARLRRVRADIARLDAARLSRSGYALAVVRGGGDAIARDLGAGFRLQLLRREEAAIRARLESLGRDGQVQGITARIGEFDDHIVTLEQRIASIEARYPALARLDDVPLVRNLAGPWRELRDARRALAGARGDRERLARMRDTSEAARARADAAYAEAATAMRSARAPVDALDRAISERQERLSDHWASRAWEAVRPVLGWALWVTILIVAAPPAIKAFWFFVVAPAAARLAPVRIDPGDGGGLRWAEERIAAGAGSAAGSAVSRAIRLHPGEELLVRPDHLQSSVEGATIDSQWLLSPSLPFGSLATGLIGLTRIRAGRETGATISTTRDLVDEVGVVEVPEGSSIVFKPRGLIGLIRPEARPLRLERVWRLGQLSSWLTLQLRHLVFHGPCALIVKGARGVALEPAGEGRRISGAATMGWSAGLSWSVRRSETFLAYLTGKQSLFIDRFEGPSGQVVYEELPRGPGRGGLFGRGLEGLGDAMLKVVGL